VGVRLGSNWLLQSVSHAQITMTLDTYLHVLQKEDAVFTPGECMHRKASQDN
jgi:hypothetical protein